MCCRADAAAGARLMSVNVDGIVIASGIDIYKDVGGNTAVRFAAPVTAIETQLSVTITADVCSQLPNTFYRFIEL